MSQLVVRCVGSLDRTVDLVSNVVYVAPSRWTGEIEVNRRLVVAKWTKWVTAAVIGGKMIFNAVQTYAASPAGADQIRTGFMQIIDVFTAITEPILWFYALTACILMATGRNKEMGWNRLKNVGYAYIFITLLPTFFTFLRWVAQLIGQSISM